MMVQITQFNAPIQSHERYLHSKDTYTHNKFYLNRKSIIIHDKMASFEFQSPERNRHDYDGVLRKSSVKERLDTLIENDYSVLRKGKGMDADDLLLKNHNPLVLQYVRGIYDQYNITDPLAGKVFDSRLSLTPSVKKTSKKRKMHLMSSQTIKYSTPIQEKKGNRDVNQSSDDFDLVQDEISLIKKDFFQNNTTIRASMSYFDTTQPQQRNQSNEDLRIKYHTTFGNERESSLPISQLRRDRTQMSVEREIKPTIIEEEASENSSRNVAIPHLQLPEQVINQEDSLFLPPIPAIQKPGRYSRRQSTGYVDESFRYCVGCDQPLLHANIKIHEKTCKDFQEVFQMPPQEILKYLKRKINIFYDNIARRGNELMRGDVDELQQSSQKMMEESRHIANNGTITQGFEKQYFKVIDIGKKWCLVAEQANKLNWFLKIRDRIKKQFQL